MSISEKKLEEAPVIVVGLDPEGNKVGAYIEGDLITSLIIAGGIVATMREYNFLEVRVSGGVKWTTK